MAKRNRSLSWTLATLALLFAITYASPTPAWLQGLAYYPPLHTALETIAIIFAALIFAIGWHNLRPTRPGNLVALAVVLAGVAVLDFLYLFSYPGMPILVTPANSEQALYFWLVSRALFAGAMLCVTWRRCRPLGWSSARLVLLSGMVALVALVAWVVLGHPVRLPPTLIGGTGLTPLSLTVIFALATLHALIAWALLRQRELGTAFDQPSLLISNVACLFSLLLFARSNGGPDLHLLAGLHFKVFSHYYLYRAVFRSSIHEPFRELQITKAARDQLAAIVEETTDFVALADPAGRVVSLNRSARELLELPPSSPPPDLHISDLQGDVTPQLACAAEQGSWSGEAVFVGPNGQARVVSQVIMAHRSEQGQVERFSTIARDITKQKQVEERLAYLADRDPLTGLYNRRRFVEAVALELGRAQRYKTACCVLFLDVDGLKHVNDSLGHQAGDELLHRLAKLLTDQLRPSDVAARLGGDEFAVLLPHSNLEQGVTTANRLLETLLAAPITIHGQDVRVAASIGVAVYPEHGETPQELLNHADFAMYEAKDSGRARVAAFNKADQQRAVAQNAVAWEVMIQQALDLDLFVTALQPVLELRSGKIVRHEVLLRLVDEQGRLVLPGSFLGIAERSGLIRAIDNWVIRRAIQLLKKNPDLALAINVSGASLRDGEIAQVVSRELAASGIEAGRLALEITETSAIRNLAQAQQVVQSLQRLGCSLAIDDFGMGFSGFYQLRNLPVDYLKIDGSFVRNLATEPADQHIVKAIVELARHLGKQTIAEFVEDGATLERLKALGVDYAQGYYIGKPEIWP